VAQPAPAQMAIYAGNNQTAAAGGWTPVAPSVIVRDAANLPVEGVAVNFWVGAGGRIVGPDQTTNAQGVATVGGWLLGPAGGLNRLYANTPFIQQDVLVISANAIAPESEPVATQVFAGKRFACALDSSGGVKCWGDNYFGQVGYGYYSWEQNLPAGVLGLPEGVVQIAGGLEHACALTIGGGVKCWGRNHMGQLGDGSTASKYSPVGVQGLGSGVASIAAGGEQTCAVMTTGAVKCWGSNANGQLGDTTTTSRTSPADVTGLAGGVLSISVGDSHTCARLSAGGVKCWGANGMGQLGDGTTDQRNAPVDVMGLANACAIAAGGQHTCARDASGGLACWGGNGSGQLGDGTTSSRSTPMIVNALGDASTALSAGAAHTCATTASGGVRCWGANADGRLGDGTVTQRLEPVDVLGLSGPATGVSAGSVNTCAVTRTGGAQCWGDDQRHQLGRFQTGDRTRALDVVGLTSGWSEVDGGLYHTCSLGTGGAVKCWGNNLDGQLGIGNRITQLSPVGSNRSTHETSVSAGGYHTCVAGGAGGMAWCAGYNGLGALGDGTTVSREFGAHVSGMSMGVTRITAGLYHSCGLTSEGGVKCWGNNGNGQLGDGTTNT